jgi:hypothetical protein
VKIVFASEADANQSAAGMDDYLRRVFVAIGGGHIASESDTAGSENAEKLKQLQLAIQGDATETKKTSIMSENPVETGASTFTPKEVETFLGCHTRLNLWTTIGALGVASFLLMRENPKYVDILCLVLCLFIYLFV